MPYLEDFKAPIITPKDYGQYLQNNNKHHSNKHKNKK